MNNGGRLVGDIARLIALFAPHCADRDTIDVLASMTANDRLWPKAHELFRRIRPKTLAAERERNRVLAAQYLFEEICAKTLYNLSHSSAPFDPDSPYWLVPNAFALARELEMDPLPVLEIVSA